MERRGFDKSYLYKKIIDHLITEYEEYIWEMDEYRMDISEELDAAIRKIGELEDRLDKYENND